MQELETGPPYALEPLLRELPPTEFQAMLSRLHLRIDPAKRIDGPAQVARALVGLPLLRDTSRLPPPCRQLLHRVAEQLGALTLDAAPPAADLLVAQGLMFLRAAPLGRVTLVVPSAYLVQLGPWDGEDLRGLRALIARSSFETMNAIAANYLGRPATTPIALSFEHAFRQLSSSGALIREVVSLPPSERRVLLAVDEEGGEVDTEELLSIEREPLRMRNASGPAPSRRGVGFALERRGLLIPVHPNRHIIPTEVRAIIGAADEAARTGLRQSVRDSVASGDHAPHRATFSHSPSLFAVALVLSGREVGAELREGIGTPKSLVAKLAQRFGRDPYETGLVIALGRAIGLWDASAQNSLAPPGSLSISDLSRTLYYAYRSGGSWDEARAEPELLRLSGDARDPSPARVVRELVEEALVELGEASWIPWPLLVSFLEAHPQAKGVARLFRRWAARTSSPPVSLTSVAKRIVLESLPALGVLDTGVDGGGEGAEPQLSVKPTGRGRALLSGDPLPGAGEPSRFIDSHILRVGPEARVADVLALAGFVEVVRAADTLDLLVGPQTLARALGSGMDADAVRARFLALAPLPDGVSRLIAQASQVLGRASLVPASGFLWVEDPSLRELLRTRKGTADLFVDPSPTAGLLVRAGVDTEKLTRRVRALGVEIVADGAVARARTLPPATTR